MRSNRLQRRSRVILRRRTDRAEDAVAWVLTAAALLAVVLALVVGAHVYGDGKARAHAEAAVRTEVGAVVSAPPRVTAPASSGGRVARPVRVVVPVHYTTPDGVERDGEVRLPSAPAVGAPVRIWVDRAGAVTIAPASRGGALAAAIMSAGTLMGLAMLGLFGLWQLVGAAIGRVNASAWEREWAQIEPLWSRRVA